VYTSSLGRRDARTLPWRRTDVSPPKPEQQQEKEGPVQKPQPPQSKGAGGDWAAMVAARPPQRSLASSSSSSSRTESTVRTAPPPPPQQPQQPGQSKDEGGTQIMLPGPPPPPPRPEPPASASTSAPSSGGVSQFDLWMLLGPYVEYVDGGAHEQMCVAGELPTSAAWRMWASGYPRPTRADADDDGWETVQAKRPKGAQVGEGVWAKGAWACVVAVVRSYAPYCPIARRRTGLSSAPSWSGPANTQKAARRTMANRHGGWTYWRRMRRRTSGSCQTRSAWSWPSPGWPG
jgi:hypothetical protein